MIGVAERLEDRIVLAVHRQQPRPRSRCGLRMKGAAGADEAFLVGERDGAPGRQRRIGRFDPRRSGDRADDHIGGAQRRLDDRLAPGGGLDAGAVPSASFSAL